MKEAAVASGGAKHSLRRNPILSGTGKKKLKYTRVRLDELPEAFPASYYGQTDWPAHVARHALRWFLKEDGTYRIEEGFTEVLIFQENTDIILPQTINGIAITEIASSAFNAIVPSRSPIEDLEPVDLFSSSLTIPDTIEVIGDYALSGLNPLTLKIPASVKEIGILGFYANRFSTLAPRRSFEVAEANRHYCSIEGSLYTYDKDTLICHAKPYPEELTVPNEITQFGVDAFTYGPSKTRIIFIPDCLSKINSTPSRDCLWVCNHGSIAYNMLQKSGYFVVSKRFGNEDGYIYDLLDNGESMLVCYRGREVDLAPPSSFEGHPLTVIGTNAFSSGIKVITLPEGVRITLGNCLGTNLRKVTLPSSLCGIGENMFSEAQLEKPVLIPESCVAVGSGSFGNSVCIFESCGAHVALDKQVSKLCFANGKTPFDFERYDDYLLKSHRDSLKLTAFILRLSYPYQLTQSTKEEFLDYLTFHRKAVLEHLVKHDDLKALSMLLEEDFFTGEDLEKALEYFRETGYTQGIIQLISYRHVHGKSSVESRFAL